MTPPTSESLQSPSERRLAELAHYDVLGELPGEAFGQLSALAARTFGARIGMINFVSDDETLTRACFGADVGRMDRRLTFCSTVVATGAVTVIPDLREDDRFRTNPLVIPDGGARFYAGAPLVTPEGLIIGTLCVIDHAPREQVTAEQLDTLVTFAGLVMDELELRRTSRELARQNALNATMVAGPMGRVGRNVRHSAPPTARINRTTEERPPCPDRTAVIDLAASSIVRPPGLRRGRVSPPCPGTPHGW